MAWPNGGELVGITFPEFPDLIAFIARAINRAEVAWAAAGASPSQTAWVVASGPDKVNPVAADFLGIGLQTQFIENFWESAKTALMDVASHYLVVDNDLNLTSGSWTGTTLFAAAQNVYTWDSEDQIVRTQSGHEYKSPNFVGNWHILKGMIDRLKFANLNIGPTPTGDVPGVINVINCTAPDFWSETDYVFTPDPFDVTWQYIWDNGALTGLIDSDDFTDATYPWRFYSTQKTGPDANGGFYGDPQPASPAFALFSAWTGRSDPLELTFPIASQIGSVLTTRISVGWAGASGDEPIRLLYEVDSTSGELAPDGELSTVFYEDLSPTTTDKTLSLEWNDVFSDSIATQWTEGFYSSVLQPTFSARLLKNVRAYILQD